MNNIFVVSGPSGVGKDTIISELKKQGLEFREIITTTTRPMRQGESQGNPYWFVSKEEFEDLIRKNKLVEWADVYGYYYGSQKKDVEKYLNDSLPIIFKVDPQGAKTIKKEFPNSKVIFIAPENIDNLEKRLKKRGQDKPEVIKKRLKEAREEIKNLSFWDAVVINKEGKLNEAVEKVKEIIFK